MRVPVSCLEKIERVNVTNQHPTLLPEVRILIKEFSSYAKSDNWKPGEPRCFLATRHEDALSNE
jgi:hypothetical protein